MKKLPMDKKALKKYLLWFAQEHVDFRFAEIESLSKLFGIEIRFTHKDENDKMKPFWIVELPDENAVRTLASRAISLRCILELWSCSKSVFQMHKEIQEYIKENKEANKYFEPENSFKITVETYNKHFTQKEKVDKIEAFDYLPLKAKANLKNPQVQWWYIEYYGLNPCNVPAEPNYAIFGRWITDGQRNLIKELSLKSRKFIGNTSMDAQLSVLMANQGLVQPGDFVFDPFVGSGSLLVSAAKFGGYVLGADIDYMMIHAKNRPSRITQKVRENDESIKANLEQYGCKGRYIDVVVSDFSNPIWHKGFQLDSIITDPPYGIRESTEKVDTKYSSKPKGDNNEPHYPSTSHYSLHNIYNDLLKFSAIHLKLHGRLVCWFPYHKEDYSQEMIPRHKNLLLIANSEQPLSSFTSRRLLTYEKISTESVEELEENNVQFIDFRERYFSNGEHTRQERRIEKAKLKENGKMEALKRGKKLDENGKVINK